MRCSIRPITLFPTGCINYDIHGIVKLKSYIKEIHIPKFFIVERDIKPDITIYLMESSEVLRKHSPIGMSSHLRYSESAKLVSFIFRPIGLDLSYGLRDLCGQTELYLASAYNRMGKFLLYPVSGVFRPCDYVKLILNVKLLQKSHTFLVAGAFSLDGHGILISSLSGMGKTSTTLLALKELKGRFLSEDTVIINDEGLILSYPEPMRLHSRVPFLPDKYVEPMGLLERVIAKSAKVNYITILEEGSQCKFEPIDHEQAPAKLLSIKRKLVPWFAENTVQTYQCVDPSFSISQLMSKEEEIFKKFVRKADCFKLQCKRANAECYLQLLRNVVRE